MKGYIDTLGTSVVQWLVRWTLGRREGPGFKSYQGHVAVSLSKMLYPLCFVSRIRRKAGGPVSQPFYVTNNLWDVKERTHCSQRVGHVVPGVVVYLDLCRRRSGWVRCDHNGLKRLPEAPLIC